MPRLLSRHLLLAAIAVIASVNGLPLTSLFDSANHILYLFTRGSRLLNHDALSYLTSLSVSTMTLLLAGVPAALYERIRGLQQSTTASLCIWLAAAILLAHRSLRAAVGGW